MSTKKFRSVEPQEVPLKEVHNLLLGGVTPRPIALVSTLSAAGVPNLAPFSFYNAFGANPPYVAFSPAYSGRDGSAKDTLNNLREHPECVIHAVSHDIVEQMSLSSGAFPPEVDEFEKAGFTALASDLVKPLRVADSPFHMECRVEQIIELGGKNGSGNLILCQVLKFHVDENMLEDGIILPNLIDLVGRNSASYYTRASGEAVFELQKPAGVGIGFDALPKAIRESTYLSGNELAKLASLTALPGPAEVRRYFAEMDEEVRFDIHTLHEKFMAARAKGEKDTLEQVIKQALNQDEVEFAIHALLSLGN